VEHVPPIELTMIMTKPCLTGSYKEGCPPTRFSVKDAAQMFSMNGVPIAFSRNAPTKKKLHTALNVKIFLARN